MSAFRAATRQHNKAKIAVIGPSKSGKTYDALMLAHILAAEEKGEVFVIDSERGRSRIYLGLNGWQWKYVDLEPGQYSPKTYLAMLQDAINAGAAAIVIDSLTHSWAGTGGALDQKSMIDARGGNSYTNWSKVKPDVQKLLEAINAAPCHVICTMRVKTDYELVQNEKGKLAPQKVGLKPIVMSESDYEFDLVVNVDMQHTIEVEARGCTCMNGLMVNMPTEATWKPYIKWLKEGEAVESREKFDRVVNSEEEQQKIAAPSGSVKNNASETKTSTVRVSAKKQQNRAARAKVDKTECLEDIVSLARELKWKPSRLKEIAAKAKVEKLSDLSWDRLQSLRRKLLDKVAGSTEIPF